MDGNAHGHGHAHTEHDHGVLVADFHHRFWISVVLTVPVLALSPMIQSFLGLREALAFAGSAYLLFALSAAVYFYGGWPFLSGLYDELGKRTSGMMTLITLADVIRKESFEAVQRLKEMGIKCMMLAGDEQAVAKSVADELGLDDFFAEVLPEQKAE